MECKSRLQIFMREKIKLKTLCVDVALKYLLRENQITEELYSEKMNLITPEPSDPSAGIKPPQVPHTPNQEKLYLKTLDIGSMQVSL